MAIRAAGGVVCACADGASAPHMLLINDRHGAWTLPKGRLKAGESEQDAAWREIWEETAIDCVIGPLLERVSYEIEKKGRMRTKRVAYFYATAPLISPTPRTEEGISAARWCPLDEALALLSYPEFAPLLRAAVAQCVASRLP